MIPGTFLLLPERELLSISMLPITIRSGGEMNNTGHHTQRFFQYKIHHLDI